MRMVSGGYDGNVGHCIPCSSHSQCGFDGACWSRVNCSGRNGF